MIFAHLPAGYILTHHLCRHYPKCQHKWLMLSGLTGSLFPDVDLLWVWVNGEPIHTHHDYLTHFPSLWLLLALTAGTAHRTPTPPTRLLGLTLFASNGLMHLLLDYIASDIHWLAPWKNTAYSLLPAHWSRLSTFPGRLLRHALGLELAITIYALWLFGTQCYSTRSNKTSQTP